MNALRTTAALASAVAALPVEAGRKGARRLGRPSWAQQTEDDDALLDAAIAENKMEAAPRPADGQSDADAPVGCKGGRPRPSMGTLQLKGNLASESGHRTELARVDEKPRTRQAKNNRGLKKQVVEPCSGPLLMDGPPLAHRSEHHPVPMQQATTTAE